jgi:hypothetical protein
MVCRGLAICSFESILFANFYMALGSVAGSGVASMQFSEPTLAVVSALLVMLAAICRTTRAQELLSSSWTSPSPRGVLKILPALSIWAQ